MFKVFKSLTSVAIVVATISLFFCKKEVEVAKEQPKVVATSDARLSFASAEAFK